MGVPRTSGGGTRRVVLPAGSPRFHQAAEQFRSQHVARWPVEVWQELQRAGYKRQSRSQQTTNDLFPQDRRVMNLPWVTRPGTGYATIDAGWLRVEAAVRKLGFLPGIAVLVELEQRLADLRCVGGYMCPSRLLPKASVSVGDCKRLHNECVSQPPPWHLIPHKSR
jgi:hypothetical protein